MRLASASGEVFAAAACDGDASTFALLWGAGMRPPRVKRPVPARPPGFSPEWASGLKGTRRAMPAGARGLPAPHPVPTTLGQEPDTLRERLSSFAGAKPAVQLDAAKVRPSGWSNRHDSAYASPEFQRLKDLIDLAGGNQQPIIVRQVDDGYEIVCGHRRHRACSELGLPVFAVVWDEPLSSLDLFLVMVWENRERVDPSPYDQGRMYLQALDGGLFRSQRRLALSIGVSHTWVRKAIQIAGLPAEVIDAFLDPAAIQPAHAEDIAVALAADAAAVIGRATELVATKRIAKRSATDVAHRLVGRETPQEATFLIRCGSKTVGHWRRDGKGRAVITLDVGVSNEAAMERVVAAIEEALAGGVET